MEETATVLFFVRKKLLGVAIVVFIAGGGLGQCGGADRDPVLRQNGNGGSLSGLGSSGSRRTFLKLNGTSLNGMNGHASPRDLYRQKVEKP